MNIKPYDPTTAPAWAAGFLEGFPMEDQRLIISEIASFKSQDRPPLNRHARDGSEAFSQLPRAQRRKLLDDEARARKAGTWTPWETFILPPGGVGSGKGWLAGIAAAVRNNVFCVLVRPLPHATGARAHLVISSLSGVRPTWLEAQRIKNDFAGMAATAVEIYPPAGDVMDDADAYHLWVLAAPLPFALKRRDPAADVE